MKNFIKNILKNNFGVTIQKVKDPIIEIYNTNLIGLFNRLVITLNKSDINLIEKNNIKQFCLYIVNNKNLTYSQLFQDLAFLFFCGIPNKKEIYVEVGVGNGLDHSNSYMLEKHFNMFGLMIEPDPRQKANIEMVRSGKCLSYAASFKEQELQFNLASTPELSWIGLNKPSDDLNRISTELVKVYAKPLDDILEENVEKEQEIGFLSIDVEGAEEDVLKGFTIGKWNPKFICIEHNRNKSQKELFRNYFSKNYTLVLENLSDCDYWFLRNDLVK